jgi:S1-C subfamily serine protease
MFIFIMCLGQQALAKANNPPKISSLTASVSSVKSQVKVKLTVVAKDLDKDKLTYQWSQANNLTEKGTFSGSGTAVYWTAPRVSEEKRITLQVKVLDNKKGTVTKSITLTVTPKPLTQLYEELKSSVVSIKTELGQGTGFVYSNEDEMITIATNYHVIRGAKKVQVTLSNGKTYSDTFFAYQDFSSDWALFTIDAVNLKPVIIQKQTPKIGEEVFTIGNPEGLGWSMSAGIISDNAREVSGEKYLQTTTPVNPGNSGGPLFNRKGEVIGIVTSKLSNAENLNFALPITKVNTSLDASVFMPFEDYFSEGAIEGRIDEFVEYFNEDKDWKTMKVGENESYNLSYANGMWENENKEVFFGIDVKVNYEQFLKLYKSHQENKDFNEVFFTRNCNLSDFMFNYSGAEPFYTYYVVVDSLATPPTSPLIPADSVEYKNGKYNIYWNFYTMTMDSTGCYESWYNDKQ